MEDEPNHTERSRLINNMAQNFDGRDGPHREIIRQMIFHENELFDQRRSHFALLQGLMWASAALLVQSDPCKANADLVYILAGSGALLALVSAISFRLTDFAIGQLLEDVQNAGNPAPAAQRPAPVIGFIRSPDVDFKTQAVLFMNKREIVPGVLVLTWVLFAIFVSKKEKFACP